MVNDEQWITEEAIFLARFATYDSRLPKNEKAPTQGRGLFHFYPGDDRLSHAVARAVPWALEGLTSMFGMGTGWPFGPRPYAIGTNA